MWPWLRLLHYKKTTANWKNKSIRRYYHETSPVDFLHVFLYYKFCEIVYLYVQMRHYLIKYALLCIHFQNKIWTLDKARFKMFSFIWHIRVQGFHTGHFGYIFLSLHKSENIVNVFRNKMFYVLWMKPMEKPSEYEWMFSKCYWSVLA